VRRCGARECDRARGKRIRRSERSERANRPPERGIHVRIAMGEAPTWRKLYCPNRIGDLRPTHFVSVDRLGSGSSTDCILRSRYASADECCVNRVGVRWIVLTRPADLGLSPLEQLHLLVDHAWNTSRAVIDIQLYASAPRSVILTLAIVDLLYTQPGSSGE
jgi:hypothetical protein